MDCSLPGSSIHGIFPARKWSGLPLPSPLLWLELPKLLNSSGESGHPCLIPGFTGNAFSFLPLRIMFAVGLLYMAFIMLRYVPSVPALWRFSEPGNGDSTRKGPVVGELTLGECQRCVVQRTRGRRGRVKLETRQDHMGHECYCDLCPRAVGNRYILSRGVWMTSEDINRKS